MIKTADNVYKKAYVEANEIIIHLPEEEQNKIPNTLKNNLIKNMDKSYHFQFDEEKKLDEQTVLPETKALMIAIYQKYLIKANEKKFWDKYNKICYKMIEEEKNKNYNIDLFSNLNQNNNKDNNKNEKKLVVVKKITFIERIKKIYNEKIKCGILKIFKV